MQPTFCLYRDASLQKRLGIRTIVVWKVQRSTEFESYWDRIEQVWSLSCIKPTSPVSCLTYGKVPTGYSEVAKAVPLEPEQFYSVWLPGFRGVDSEDRYFIIRLDDNRIPERLESH